MCFVKWEVTSLGQSSTIDDWGWKVQKGTCMRTNYNRLEKNLRSKISRLS